MISGDVLNELWSKCAPNIRQQVENTARRRLGEGGVESDQSMTDVSEPTTPAISNLEIADHSPRTPRKQSLPTVTFSFSKHDGSQKSSRVDDGGIQPYDPDPFLNTDLDSIRSRSRRGSLAPPPPDAPQSGRNETQNNTSTVIRSRSSTPLPFTSKHPSTPPEYQVYSKRPRTVQRRPSPFSQGPLPDTILIQIFQHLNVRQLMRLRRVSVHWSKLLNHSPDLLHVLDLREFNRVMTDKLLIDTICPFVGSRPVVVDISNCFHVTDEGFSALASTCATNARVWRMKSVWDVTPQAVLEMANKAKGLEEIDLSNCRKVSDPLLARVVGWVVQDFSYNTYTQPNGSFNSTFIKSGNPHGLIHPPHSIVVGCPNLKRITLSYCKHVTDRFMGHLAIYAASRVEEIDLTRCTTITDVGFQHWSKHHFTRLHKLCLADCTYLTDKAIVNLTDAAKGLRELDLVREFSTPESDHFHRD